MLLDHLYRIYETADGDDPVDLLQQDRGAEPVDAALEIVGVDPADRAVSYAVDAGLLDAGVATNLEKSVPTVQDVATIEHADLIISTGASGMLPRFHWNGSWKRASTAAHGWRISCCACSISAPRKKC